MSTGDVVRGQTPGPETVGVIGGDRGIEMQKNRFLNRPRYVEIRDYTGPGGDQEIRYRNIAHMPVTAQGHSVNPIAYGVNGASCGNGGCNGSCGNGNCGNGNCGDGNCGDGSCNGDCNGDCQDGCGCGQCHIGGCGNAIGRYITEGYPTHVHKFSYYPPKNLSYPAPNVPAAVVQYPYYTVKGPDDFFLN